ncbi:MAG: DUF1127 domain-containing protein [Granulosicoccaceae bacterium]
MNTACNVIPSNRCVEDKQFHNLAMPIANPLIRLEAYLVKRRNRRLDRSAMKDLLSMDDNTLNDIGISRGDVQWASNLPLSVSATTELDFIARRSHRNHQR